MKVTTIGKAFKLRSGITLSAKNMVEGLFPVYGGNGISGYHNAHLFEDKKIIIGRVGAYCGNVHLTSSKSWITDNALYIDQYFEEYNTNYLLQLLRSLNLNKFASQSGQPLISAGRLKDVQIPLPPIPTQKKIAAILDEADKLRQLDKALIGKYDQLAQSLFLEMFGDPVTNPKEWPTQSIVAFAKDEKYAIKRGPFGGALKKEIFVEKGYLVYEQYHALNNDFSMARYFIDKSKFEELIGFAVKPGDIIISCSGVYLGKLAIIPDNAREGIINQALLKITLNESKMRNDFFVFHFTQESFKKAFFDSNRGAGIPNFPPMKEFKQFPFISPPISLQNRFATQVQAIETQKAQAQKALAKSEELFNSLLQKAFRGELI